MLPGTPAQSGGPAAGIMPPGKPGGTGAATMPGPMAGGTAQGLAAVKTALEALQKALPLIPLGSELHSEVLKAVSGIAKHMETAGAGGDQSAVIQQLAAMMRERQQNPPNMAAMMPHPAASAAPSPPIPGA